jgi:hypothetical protein
MTYLLQLHSHIKITRTDFPIRSSNYKVTRKREQENKRKYYIRLQREEENREEPNSPYHKIQRNTSIVSYGSGALGCVTSSWIWVCDGPGRRLQNAEREPEYREHAHNNHGEEIAHDPFEDCREEKEDWTGEEEDTTMRERTS